MKRVLTMFRMMVQAIATKTMINPYWISESDVLVTITMIRTTQEMNYSNPANAHNEQLTNVMGIVILDARQMINVIANVIVIGNGIIFEVDRVCATVALVLELLLVLLLLIWHIPDTLVYPDGHAD